jgi:sulfatase modifying factor 1
MMPNSCAAQPMPCTLIRLLAVSWPIAGISLAQALDGPESMSAAGTVLRDCADCPELVVVPAGSFLMAAPTESAAARLIAVDRPFAIGRFEITRAEYAQFVAATGYRVGSKCFVFESAGAGGVGIFNWREGRSWRDPGYRQTDRDPVVCTSWDDAHAYIAWLSLKAGRAYRLPSEAEWTYVASAGTGRLPPWDSRDASCLHANSADRALKQQYPTLAESSDCDDGYAFTAPVGSFTPSSWGLYDLLGNVWEWTEDCGGNCQNRVRRSGSWYRPVVNHHSALPKADWHGNAGFRVARALD